MGTLAMIGAIAFDPAIRGILVVLVGSVVLMGSIYMIVSTNSGVRVGFLISASALCGWMFLMGSLWVIYGIGLVGRAPAWMVTDINLSRETPVEQVPELSKLPAENALPKAEELLDRYPLLHAIVLGSEGSDYTPATLTKLKTIVQPWVILDVAEVPDLVTKSKDQAGSVISGDSEVAGLLDGSPTALATEIRKQASALREEIEEPLNGWCLLTESDPWRGEAVASADGSLAAQKIFGDSTTSADYLVDDVFFWGGKIDCNPVEEKSMVSRTWDRVASVFEVKNPKLLGAVTLVKAQDVVVEPGGTPPPAAKEKGASTVTVVMLRNLGNKRFIPFMFALVNLLGFVLFTTMLHYRDKQAMAIRSAFTPSKN